MKFRIKNGMRAALALSLAFTSANVFAAGAPVPSEAAQPLAIGLIILILALLLVIGLLGYVLTGAAEVSLQRSKENAATTAKTVAIALFCLLSPAAFAGEAEATTKAVTTAFGGLSKTSFYTLLTIIGLELLVIVVMLYHVRVLLAKEKLVVVTKAKEAITPLLKTWWEKANSFKPAHEVTDTGHNYDGIRELDNKLPPWWLYGFYVCVIFSAIYLYRYEVAHTAPSTVQEYEIAMAKAELEKEAYLKNAANKVDENTVAMLTDAADLSQGQKLFGASCAACHGAEGQGTVGPNLTDEYWLHKGSVKDVFKSIKYGIPEKGMKAWKDDFSPVQIAQIASYIKSINGTNPANAKEPQGELFKDEMTESDSTVNANKLAAIK